MNLLFPAAACARVWGDPCLPAVYLPDPGLDAVSLGLRRPGRAAGRQPRHFKHWLCRQSPKQVCFVSVGASARARWRGAARPLYRNQYLPPPTPTPPSPQWRGVYVCFVCVYARAHAWGQRVRAPHTPCPKTRLPLRASGLAPTPMGVRCCSSAGAPALQTSRGPALSPEAARPRAGLLRIQGTLARRQAGRPAARARECLQRAGVGGGEPAVRKSRKDGENSPVPPRHAALPLPVSPAHLSALFRIPDSSDSLQNRQ